MSKPKLVIFDMDGLILDSEPTITKYLEQAAIGLGTPFKPGLLHKLVGQNIDRSRGIVKNEMGDSFPYDEIHKQGFALFDEHVNKYGVDLKPGLLEILDALEEMNIKKCVATSTEAYRAKHELEVVGIYHRFETLTGGDMVKKSKPDPEIFLKAAASCNVAPGDCIVLEDSPAGTQGGYDAGMRVIVVPDMVKPPEKTKTQAFAICKDLYEVLDIIRFL